MSIWNRIGDALSALTSGENLCKVFDHLKTPPERSVAFTIAVIGLGAKMAKADGLVTKDEVAAFRQVFHIPKRDEPQAAKVFNLARQDVAGYEIYARTVARMFKENDEILQNLIEGLFHIALADGKYHPEENDYVHRVAGYFGLSPKQIRGLRTRFVPDAPPDAYDVLNVSPDDDLETIHQAWRRLVRETHPDQLMAHGLPEEAITLATKRLIAVNHAWEEISDMRADG